MQSEAFRIGKWLVEPALNKISSENQTFKVEPKVVRVLEYLAKNQGQLVTKADLLKHVWDDTVVTDNSLNRVVSIIRKTLNEDPYHPEYVETIAKSGYRLIKKVEWIGAEQADTNFVRRDSHNAGNRILLKYSPLILLLLIMSGFLIYKKSLVSDRRSLKVTPFTSYPGNESMPQFSPDGAAIAFVREEDKNSDIYVKLLDTGNPVRLTHHEGEELFPSWSPDGMSIAFVSVVGDSSAVISKPYIGGPEKTLIPWQSVEIQGIDWSANGRAMYVSQKSSLNQPFTVYRYDLAANTKTQITHPEERFVGDRSPVLSPDGELLAFERTEVLGVEDIYVVSADGGREMKLTSDYLKIFGLDWQTDGTGITFSSNRSGLSSLWKVSLRDKKLEPLTSSGSNPGRITRSPVGREMAYEQLDYETDIWQLRLEGLAETRIISSTRPDLSAELSPDGEKFVFTSERSGHTELWYCKQDGKDPVQLTYFHGPYLTSPKWSPDAQKVAFDVRLNGKSGIMIIDIVTGHVQEVISNDRENILPSWSHNGKHIYFTSKIGQEWQIREISLKTKEVVPITKNGGYVSYQTADSTHIYLTKKGLPGIWKLNLDTNQERLILKDLDQMNWNNWVVAAGGIFYVKGYKTQMPTLFFFDEKKALSKKIKPLPNILYKSGLSYVATSNSLYYTRLERSGSDILLMQNL